MCEQTKLENYLFDGSNSHSKESLINNKLIFDLKLSAARSGYFLNIYTPEVDKDGFDIIFDDQDVLRKVQLKTVMAKAKTNSWDIHKTLLRPDQYINEQLGFESSPTGTGYQGGIILIEIEDSEEQGFQVKYYYTDIIILCGLRDEIIKVSNKPSVKALNTFIKNINKGTSHEKITIYKNMFIEAKDSAGLLALMGLHNTRGNEVFRYHIQCLVEPCDEKKLPSPRDKLSESVNKELQCISNSMA